MNSAPAHSTYSEKHFRSMQRKVAAKELCQDSLCRNCWRPESTNKRSAHCHIDGNVRLRFRMALSLKGHGCSGLVVQIVVRASNSTCTWCYRTPARHLPFAHMVTFHKAMSHRDAELAMVELRSQLAHSSEVGLMQQICACAYICQVPWWHVHCGPSTRAQWDPFELLVSSQCGLSSPCGLHSVQLAAPSRRLLTCGQVDVRAAQHGLDRPL